MFNVVKGRKTSGGGELGIESDDVANYVFPKTWPSRSRRETRLVLQPFADDADPLRTDDSNFINSARS